MHARAHVHVHVHAHASSLNGVRFQGVPLASLNFNQISLSHWLRATLSLQPMHRLHYLSHGQMESCLITVSLLCWQYKERWGHLTLEL